MPSRHPLCFSIAIMAGSTLVPTWAAEDAQDTQLSTLTITAQQAATKVETPFIETPQSISVITDEQIEEQGSQTVQQATRYTPGVFSNQIGASKRYDYLVLRGFADGSIDNIYLDGLKVLGDSGTFTSLQIDPYFLKRIEVVKGPSSVLYGRASPGGLVALTSKQPLFERYRQVQATIGTQGQRSTGFDFSGQVGDSGRMAYRLTGLAQQSDTQFDHLEEERYAIAPSFTVDLSDATSLTLQAYLQKDPEGGSHSGLPAEGTLFPRNGRKISRHFFEGEPDFETFDRSQVMLGYQLEHTFNDTWSARQNFRYLNAEVELDQVYAYGWASETELNRYYSGADETLDAYAVDNQLRADFATGAADHTMLFGVDYQRRKADVDWFSGTFPPIDAFDPEYGAEPLSIVQTNQDRRRLEQTGVYVQDQIALGNWRLTLGGRQDWVELSTTDRESGTGTEGDWSKFSGRAGLLYLFDNGVALYLSYSESFNPNSYADQDGNLLELTEGSQYELGLKYQPPGSENQFTAALFHIDQENVATKRPAEPFYRPVGAIRSQGLELEARMRITDAFHLLAGYTYTDIRYHRAEDGTQGNDTNMAPRHLASLWGNYAFGSGALRGVTLGGGVRYVGESWADKENTLRVPAYTLVDASLGLDLSRFGLTGMEARINANNLLDKEYIASCYDLDFCYFGEERNVTATLSYEF
ncbi:hypothetical protein L861_15930 [Litchfieldella anticariensis FP35 = DSM 16096]|uniref:Ferrioxamine B receptor n=1 Tax=Litchfieldella anticariensis (strain DSM 16096 / CECT 5854 / CIP 108499 / LMG 22089 / FP35) TaxID=1121939 RepID=S2KJ62_LITA3|nr:TonB-dependent siderophore receptor [Halomonas anticariensis]EPC02197.1 hypothetical protein L861_15930 [Halomonas anticariensis FP35 = DSM 16096]